MKVSELEGALLDCWVARADGKDGRIVKSYSQCNADYFELRSGTPFRPSTSWAHGGPLIEKYRMYVDGGNPHDQGWSAATGPSNMAEHACGPTPLVAICRAVVRAIYGDEVPDEAPEAR